MLDRLNEIEADLLARRARAEAEAWLGEIEGIDLTLTFLRAKRDDTQRRSTRPAVDLGLPAPPAIHSAGGADMSHWLPLLIPIQQPALPPRTWLPFIQIRVGVGQCSATELGIKPSHDAVQIAPSAPRQMVQLPLQPVTRPDRTAVRVRPRNIQPPIGLFQEPLVVIKNARDIRRPQLPRIAAPDHSPRGAPAGLAGPGSRTKRSAHSARRPTRHRPFGSRSLCHPATASTPRPQQPQLGQNEEATKLAHDRLVQISTADFKIRVIGRYLKAHGASATNPATIGIGISLDEIHRANNRRSEACERIVYPLLDLGIRRTDCPRIIRSAGLPVPPKSACWFCPFHRLSAWKDMRRDQPDLFAKACHLEDTLNARRRMLQRDPVWLTRYNAPLSDVVPLEDPLPIDDSDASRTAVGASPDHRARHRHPAHCIHRRFTVETLKYKDLPELPTVVDIMTAARALGSHGPTPTTSPAATSSPAASSALGPATGYPPQTCSSCSARAGTPGGQPTLQADRDVIAGLRATFNPDAAECRQGH
ncbi:hypothetical protein [Actinomadura rudentiformis]|uniref:hypothetical protein n=1 Tax=Actinomadura rudentiformis TaxID=359158 RepID=UPI001CEFAA62|nr:hypothetical protein [Actinomadura rudentiformis]